MDKKTLEELERKTKEYSADDVAKLYLEYAKLTKNYSAAIKEVQTKLQILDEDFEMMHDHDPIHHMETRVKSMESILGKLERKGFDLSMDSITENLTDIAGVRVICHYVEDIYAVAALLGSGTYYLLVSCDFPVPFATLCAVAATVSLRMLARHYQWNLPKALK